MRLLRGGCVLCGSGRPSLCGSCWDRLDDPPTARVRDVGTVPALFAYAGQGAAVVQALKYRDGRRLVAPLAAGLAGLVAPRVDAMPQPVLTWVPTTGAQRRRRGFDQSELLARAVGRRLDVPVRGLLSHRPGPRQTGSGRAERVSRAAHAYRPGRRPPTRGASVVVVDDVCTTGSTLRSVAGCLRSEGADRIDAVVVARTP